MFKGITRLIGGTLAVVILLSALVGYLPTSSCRCRDPKVPKNQKIQCFFGQLRSLSISLISGPAVNFSVIVRQVPIVALFEYEVLKGKAPFYAFDAQAPPLRG